MAIYERTLIDKQDVIDAMTDDNIIRYMDSVYDSALHRIKRSVLRILDNLPEALTREDIKLIRSSLQLKRLAMLQEWYDEAGYSVDKIYRVDELMAIMDEILKED